MDHLLDSKEIISSKASTNGFSHIMDASSSEQANDGRWDSVNFALWEGEVLSGS